MIVIDSGDVPAVAIVPIVHGVRIALIAVVVCAVSALSRIMNIAASHLAFNRDTFGASSFRYVMRTQSTTINSRENVESNSHPVSVTSTLSISLAPSRSSAR